MGALLDRYISGEYETVWAEMLAGIDQDTNPISEAEQWSVAEETMSRARQNIETIIERLNSIGYQFGVYPDGTLPRDGKPFEGPLILPPPDTAEKIRQIEALVGAIPISLKAFWSIVGSVNLVGAFPPWKNFSLDPLWVDGPDLEYILKTSEEWQENLIEYGAEEVGEYLLALAPDHFHKDRTSGGGPYGISLPNPAADADFEYEWNNTTFVNYLRICFKWGGFPNPYRNPNTELSELDFLSKDLLPI